MLFLLQCHSVYYLKVTINHTFDSFPQVLHIMKKWLVTLGLTCKICISLFLTFKIYLTARLNMHSLIRCTGVNTSCSQVGYSTEAKTLCFTYCRNCIHQLWFIIQLEHYNTNWRQNQSLLQWFQFLSITVCSLSKSVKYLSKHCLSYLKIITHKICCWWYGKYSDLFKHCQVTF